MNEVGEYCSPRETEVFSTLLALFDSRWSYGPAHDHIFNQNLENRFVSAARA